MALKRIKENKTTCKCLRLPKAAQVEGAKTTLAFFNGPSFIGFKIRPDMAA